jgi:hypothetical protein
MVKGQYKKKFKEKNVKISYEIKQLQSEIMTHQSYLTYKIVFIVTI